MGAGVHIEERAGAIGLMRHHDSLAGLALAKFPVEARVYVCAEALLTSLEDDNAYLAGSLFLGLYGRMKFALGLVEGKVCHLALLGSNADGVLGVEAEVVK